jgi:excinuclease UvrABC nuclease subunit
VNTKTVVKPIDVHHFGSSRLEIIYNPPALHLDGSVAYSAGWALLVPASSGVYFIHDLRGFLYIGRTNNLNVRFGQHYWGSHNRAVNAALKRPVGQTQFSWMTCDDEAAVTLEKEYIRGYQPLANGIRYSKN